MSAPVYISIGSNVDPQDNIRIAINAMHEVFGNLRLSPIYQSAAVGFEGDDFLNLVAGFDTEKPVEQVFDEARQIENKQGRDRTQPRFSARSIDLDILLYDSQVINLPGLSIPRHEILQSAHVLKPLQDLIPDTRHPVTGESYADLWRKLSISAPRLDVVEIDLN
jgi:2-amino-4-hydroxy-6-hydroxymethyldihydropteridine diphosphokinase